MSIASPVSLRLPLCGRRIKLCRFSASCASHFPPPALVSNAHDTNSEGQGLVFDGVVQESGRMRLDSWLVLQLPDHISRARVQNSIRSGLASVNGQSMNKVSFSVRLGDHVKCTVAALVPLKADPEDIPLDIVFEDDHVIVVNKPADMVTHPAPGNWRGTLVNALLHHCELPLIKDSQKLSEDTFVRQCDANVDDVSDEEIEGLEEIESAGLTGGHSSVVRPGIVHRLDKGTSGLLVIAKDERAHEHLSKQFKDRSIKRSYLSLTCGVPSNEEGCVDVAIGRDTINRTRMAVVRNSSSNRKFRVAVSNYKVLEELANGGAALVKWKLQTGRTHQIRVHAQYLGHPLLGDDLYGGTKGAALSHILPKIPSFKHGIFKKLIGELQRPYLHAASLGFIHPHSQKEVSFSSPLPADFEELWQRLQNIQ